MVIVKQKFKHQRQRYTAEFGGSAGQDGKTEWGLMVHRTTFLGGTSPANLDFMLAINCSGEVAGPLYQYVLGRLLELPRDLWSRVLDGSERTLQQAQILDPSANWSVKLDTHTGLGYADGQPRRGS